jgi:hypothetical protein
MLPKRRVSSQSVVLEGTDATPMSHRTGSPPGALKSSTRPEENGVRPSSTSSR